MESIQITGEIIRIGDKLEFGNDFCKVEVVIKTDDKYPQEIPIEFFREDKIALIQNVRVGDTITAHCNLQGREWKDHDKWFLSLSCWRIENASSDAPDDEPQMSKHEEKKADGYAPTGPARSGRPAGQPDPAAFESDDESDDIPF